METVASRVGGRRTKATASQTSANSRCSQIRRWFVKPSPAGGATSGLRRPQSQVFPVHTTFEGKQSQDTARMLRNEFNGHHLSTNNGKLDGIMKIGGKQAPQVLALEATYQT